MRYLLALQLMVLTFAPAVSLAVEDLPNLHEVHEGILRGGRPSHVGLKQLKAQGVKTLINIENNPQAIEQERTWAKSLGFRYVSAPMDWRTPPTDAQIESLLRQLQNEKIFPLYLHCKHGEDRTGMVFGLYRVFVDKWTPKRAYQEMLKLGFHPEYQALDNYFRERTDY